MEVFLTNDLEGGGGLVVEVDLEEDFEENDFCSARFELKDLEGGGGGLGNEDLRTDGFMVLFFRVMILDFIFCVDIVTGDKIEEGVVVVRLEYD